MPGFTECDQQSLTDTELKGCSMSGTPLHTEVTTKDWTKDEDINANVCNGMREQADGIIVAADKCGVG